MNKNIAIGIVAVILVAGGISWFVQRYNSSSYGTNNLPLPNPVIAPTRNTTSVPPPTSAPVVVPTISNVTIQNFSFGKSSITVKKGTTVIWTNLDSTGHTVTGNNGGPSSPTIGAQGTYNYTFNSVGTFPYHCAVHPSMTGTVVVTQ